MKKEEMVTSLVRQSFKAAPVTRALFESVYQRAGEAAGGFCSTGLIILTGCGDSYCAALAMQPAFEQLTGCRTVATRCINVSRHMTPDRFRSPEGPALVVGISCSGNVSRVTEAMMRAKELGADTLAVTFNPESPVGSAAGLSVSPQFPHEIAKLEGPGSLSYNSSLMGLLAFALKLGVAKGRVSLEEEKAVIDGLYQYLDAAQAAADAFDDRAFQLAQSWKDMDSFDFIGDHSDYATAFMGSAKVLEATGGRTTYDDSEDWCHINYFLHQPQRIVRVVIANSDTASFGRLLETCRTIDAIGSPMLVVTDADPSLFPKSAEVVSMPKPRNFWLAPVMQHLIYDKVIGYIAGICGTAGFRRDGDPENPFLNDFVKDQHRIRESEIRIVK